jgi:putative two-component system response regulator
MPTSTWVTAAGSVPQQASIEVLMLGHRQGAATGIRDRLEREGFPVVVAPSLTDAVVSVAVAQPALVLIDLDLLEPGVVTWCERLKRDTSTRLMPVVVLTANTTRQHRVDLIAAGVDAVLAKPVDTDELLARVRSAARTRQVVSDLESATSVIMTLTSMLEAREASPGHCHRLANYAMALGRAIGLEDAEGRALYRGAFLHDIGMLALPHAIVRKDGPLDPDEFEVVKSHTVIGDALCANLRSLHVVRPIVRHHHEKLDGSGYPDQLRGDDIPLLAQIVGIVDAFEAITAGRSYTPARSNAEAVRRLRAEVQLGWRRRDLVEVFADMVAKGALEHSVAAAASVRPRTNGTSGPDTGDTRHELR